MYAQRGVTCVNTKSLRNNYYRQIRVRNIWGQTLDRSIAHLKFTCQCVCIFTITVSIRYESSVDGIRLFRTKNRHQSVINYETVFTVSTVVFVILRPSIDTNRSPTVKSIWFQCLSYNCVSRVNERLFARFNLIVGIDQLDRVFFFFYIY